MSTNQISSAPSGSPVLRARGLAMLTLAISIAVTGLSAGAADTDPPDLACGQDKPAECGSDWFFDIPTAKDETGGANVLIEVVSTVTNVAVPRCPALFSVTRTWRATDTSTNSSFCNQTVTVVDTEPPNITCEESKEVQCGTDWAFDIPTAVDKCDLNNVLIEVVSTVTNVAIPRCPKLFRVTRTWRASDTCGNSSFCNQTVTIVDTEPPNITCGMNKQAECGDGWAFDIPTAVDKCDLNNVLIEVVATVTNVAIPRCPRIFSVTRTWRASDTCGNSSFCNQTVTVVDMEPPEFICGQDKCVPATWRFDLPTAWDKCDRSNVLIQVVATVTNVINPAGTVFFSVTRTWRASDTCGNSSFCNQSLTIIDPALDTNAPVFAHVPSNENFQCLGDLPPPARVTATDDCSGDIIPTLISVTNGSCPTIITRTWTAVDTFSKSNSVTQLITVRDTIPPVIRCPTNISVQCVTDLPPCPISLAAFRTSGGAASDNCDTNLIYSCSDGPLIGGSCCGTIVRTHIVTDDCTNSASCVQIINVQDTVPPDITCPTDIVVTNDPGQCSAVVNYEVSATDNCGGCTLLSEDFNTSAGGFTVVTPEAFNTPWIYDAGAGSWRVIQDGTEVGHPMTSLLHGPAINVTCAGQVRLTFVHRWSMEQGNWDGGQVRISVNGGPYTTVPAAAFTTNGYNGLVLAGSRSGLAGQPAFVLDSPNHQGPGYVTSVADLGLFSAGDTISVEFLYAGDTNTRGNFVPNWEVDSVALAAGNGSNPVTVVCDPPFGSTFPVGTNIVCCTATDAAGNSNTCCFTVTVEDREAPQAACVPGVNPSGKKIPVAGKNPASGQNPDGFYQLLGRDNCEANPALAIYIADTGSSFIAGPFASGDVIKLTQSPGKTPSQDPAPDPIVAHIHLKGDGLLFAVDANGNVSEPELCLVPRPPK